MNFVSQQTIVREFAEQRDDVLGMAVAGNVKGRRRHPRPWTLPDFLLHDQSDRFRPSEIGLAVQRKGKTRQEHSGGGGACQPVAHGPPAHGRPAGTPQRIFHVAEREKRQKHAQPQLKRRGPPVNPDGPATETQNGPVPEVQGVGDHSQVDHRRSGQNVVRRGLRAQLCHQERRQADDDDGGLNGVLQRNEQRRHQRAEDPHRVQFPQRTRPVPGTVPLAQESRDPAPNSHKRVGIKK